MRRNLERKFSGYQYILRSRHLTALKFNLSDFEYRLFDLFTTLYGWDSENLYSYGKVEASDRDLAKLLNCSPSKVCRARKRLIELRLIRKLEPCVYEVDFALFVTTPKQWNAGKKHQSTSLQQDDAGLRQNRSYDTPNSLVSSKDDNNVFTLQDIRDIEDSLAESWEGEL